MTVQFMIKIDPAARASLAKLAQREGKSASQIVRELINEYVKQRDMSGYVDALWSAMGQQAKAAGFRTGDVGKIIRAARTETRGARARRR